VGARNYTTLDRKIGCRPRNAVYGPEQAVKVVQLDTAGVRSPNRRSPTDAPSRAQPRPRDSGPGLRAQAGPRALRDQDLDSAGGPVERARIDSIGTAHSPKPAAVNTCLSFVGERLV
jgi:hypothetical protein